MLLGKSPISLIDRLVGASRRLKNRFRLQRTTAAYFQDISPNALAEERKLESALFESTTAVDFND